MPSRTMVRTIEGAGWGFGYGVCATEPYVRRGDPGWTGPGPQTGGARTHHPAGGLPLRMDRSGVVRRTRSAAGRRHPGYSRCSRSRRSVGAFDQQARFLRRESPGSAGSDGFRRFAVQATRTLPRHVLGAIVEALLVVAIIVAVVLAAAPLVRPTWLPGADAGGRNSATPISVPDGVFAGTTTATAGAAYRWVHARCSQDGVLVYEQWVKTGADGRGTFNLGPTPMWQGGAADCWAEDGSWTKSRWRRASSTTFHVSG